jgi:MFS family permease
MQASSANDKQRPARQEAPAALRDEEGVMGEDRAVARTDSRTVWARLYFLIVIIILQVFSTTDRSVLAVMVPEIKADLRLTDFAIGMLQGIAFVVFYSVFGLLIGAAVDRYSRRVIMYLGVTAWSLATAATGVAANLPQMFAGRMAVGLGESSMGPSVASMASDIFPANRLSFVLSLYAGVGVIGTGVSLAVGGWLMDNIPHWQASYPGALATMPAWRIVLIIIGLPGALVAFLALTLKEPERRTDRKSADKVTWRHFLQIFNERRSLILKMLLGYGILSMGSWPVVNWAPTYARRLLGFTAGEIGWAMGLIVAIGGVAGSVAVGLLVDLLFSRGIRDAAMRIASAAALLVLPFVVAAFLIPSKAVFLLGILLIVILVQSQFGTALAIIQMVCPAQARGRMTALQLLTFNLIGVSLGPMAVGALTDFVYRADDKVGYSIVTVSVVCLPTAAYLLWSARAEFKRWLLPAQ